MNTLTNLFINVFSYWGKKHMLQNLVIELKRTKLVAIAKCYPYVLRVLSIE